MIVVSYLCSNLNRMTKDEAKQCISNYRIALKNHKENIKDARHAKRHSSSKDDIEMYLKVIRYNKARSKECKEIIRVLKLSAESSTGLWIIAIALCIIIALLFPDASVFAILAPVIVVCIIGALTVFYLISRK